MAAALLGRRHLHGGLLRLMVRRHYPRAEAGIAISEGVAASVSAVAGVAPERVVTIPNPIDTAAIHQKAEQPPAQHWLAPGALPRSTAVGQQKTPKELVTPPPALY